MPLIIKGMGYEALEANLMSITPFVAGAIGLFISMYLSDRLHERSLIIVTAMVLSIIGFTVLISSRNARLRYAFVHVCMMGAGAGGPLVTS
ncbi:hypothetical protein EG328_011705 [Venturia inaequalis]|uniref:Major facilitator superfamily (MFS) profile domain-containing protein n=1 Tax=Venturia inaequalis TaxID=5025 RepID=A0A8H3Z0R1_VENIN|nr:hypothetical protein EG328_011705 [Venturia inaequalis]